MAKLELDYSELNSTSLVPLAQEEWEPPVHKFFGKKLPNGKTEKEPVYQHKEFPRIMYGKRGDKIVARLVHSQEEKDALGENWATNPAAFGLITAPSFEQRLEMEAAERAEQEAHRGEAINTDINKADAVEVGTVPRGTVPRGPGRPRKAD